MTKLDASEIKYLPPQEIEAEQMVLGACLLDPDHTITSAAVRVEDFYKTAHRKIWAMMLDMRQRGEDVDIVTLAAALRGVQELDALGGPATYLSQLLSLAPTAANIRAHEQIVINAAIRRLIIRACTEARENAYGPGNGDAIISRCITALTEARQRNTVDIMTYRDITAQGFAEIEKRSENPGMLHGITTGLRDVDRLTNGLKKQHFYIFAGRTGKGKTSFAMQISRAAGKAGSKVGVISVEMGPEQLGLRDISSESGVPLTRLITGNLHDEDWDPLTAAMNTLCNLPIWGAFSAFRADDVERCMDQLVQMYGCELVIVDYLQLLSIKDHTGTREGEVSLISRMHKRKAKELDIPVIALAQLNRAVEHRTDKRPTLADLRESGSLEQDADVVAFIHQDECKCPYDKQCYCGNRYKAWYLQRKGRMDGTGDAELVWDGRTTSFKDVG